jgi:hypothetical protein
MIFRQQAQKAVDQAHGTRPPGGRPQDVRGGRASRGAIERAFKSMSSLVLWVLLIGAGIGFFIGDIALRGCGKSAVQSEIDNRQPARRDLQRYSARFIDAVQHAAREKRDLLESFAVFEQIWRAVSPNEAMMIQTISPRGLDHAGREVIPPVNRPPIAINASNFREYRPLLTDIRKQILEADGTGRGQLPNTHFDAKPADGWLVPSPDRQGPR